MVGNCTILQVSLVVNRTYGGRVGLNGTDPYEQGYVNQMGLSRKHIFDGVKRSLERLQLDYIDVLQCHRFDPETPIEETVRLEQPGKFLLEWLIIYL